MDIKHRVEFGELQQIRDLPARIGELQLSPGLALVALALRTTIPLSILVLENRCAARGADCLRDRAECHDELAEPAAVDVRDFFEVEYDLVLTVGDFIADSLPKRSQGIACRDASHGVKYRDALR